MTEKRKILPLDLRNPPSIVEDHRSFRDEGWWARWEIDSGQSRYRCYFVNRPTDQDLGHGGERFFLRDGRWYTDDVTDEGYYFAFSVIERGGKQHIVVRVGWKPEKEKPNRRLLEKFETLLYHRDGGWYEEEQLKEGWYVVLVLEHEEERIIMTKLNSYNRSKKPTDLAPFEQPLYYRSGWHEDKPTE